METALCDISTSKDVALGIRCCRRTIDVPGGPPYIMVIPLRPEIHPDGHLQTSESSALRAAGLARVFLHPFKDSSLRLIQHKSSLKTQRRLL